MRKCRVLGLIPARGGSRAIPKKNIVPLADKPLLGWVAEQGLKSKLIDEVVLSSDCREIIEVAETFGVSTPFVRPAELSGEKVLVVDVIAHALRWMKDREGKDFDYLCLLQPTAPFALAEDYDRAVRMAVENDADTVISVTRCGQMHPSIMFTIEEDGRADWLLKAGPEGRMARRQDLPPIYMRTGVVYVVRSSVALEQGTLYGDRLYAIEVPPERALGIDAPLDLKLAEVLMRERAADEKGKRTS